VEAIRLVERISGEVFESRTRFGPMVHARLVAGEEASGKLVSAVRARATARAKQMEGRLLLIDGPPGVGCPVIAAISGVDMALVVAEPTPSGRQGLKRAVDVAHHFGVHTCVVVNRADLYLKEADAIEDWCRERGLQVLQRLPYDPAATEAMTEATTVVEYGDGPLAHALEGLWQELGSILDLDGREETLPDPALASTRDEGR
jgi:MinD superfamily P-loop ATPase